MTQDEMIHWAADNPLDVEVVAELCAREAISTGELFDRISRTIAVGYMAGQYKFDFCDGVANEVYAYMLRNHEVMPPDFSMSVFLAFDAGEYRHSGDPPEASSEDLYTRPLLAELLAGREPAEQSYAPSDLSKT